MALNRRQENNFLSGSFRTEGADINRKMEKNNDNTQTKSMAVFKGIFMIKAYVSDLNLETKNAMYAYLYVNPKK